jgi:hypothetical protein
VSRCSTPSLFYELDFYASCGAHGGSYTHDNLGGLGPDSGAQELRYGGVGSKDGSPFDLVITVASGSSYAKGSGANGCHSSQRYMRLAVARGTTTAFDFALRDASTNALVSLPNFDVVVLDLDKQTDAIYETLAVTGHASYTVDAATDLIVGGNSSNPTLQGTVRNLDNPSDPSSLTTAQMRSAASFLMSGTASWQMTFGISAGSPSGARNAFIGGKSSLVEVTCPPTWPTSCSRSRSPYSCATSAPSPPYTVQPTTCSTSRSR